MCFFFLSSSSDLFSMVTVTPVTDLLVKVVVVVAVGTDVTDGNVGTGLSTA